MAAPSNPAPVSGPGQLSRRTDTGPAQKLRELPNAQYGEAAVYSDLQRDAPLAQTPSPSDFGGGGGVQAPEFVPFNAPTMRPNEPVTAGADEGPGPNGSILSQPLGSTTMQQYQSARDLVSALALRDPSNPGLAHLSAAIQRTF